MLFWVVLFMMTMGGSFTCCADMLIFQKQSIFTINNVGMISAEETAWDSGPPEEGIPKETKTTKTAVSVRKVKLSKKSDKTYTEKGKVQKKIRTEIKVLSEEIITVRTVTRKRIVNKYKKGSKICTRKTITTVETERKIQTTVKGKAALGAMAPGIDGRVLNAYTTLGFVISLDPNVSYTGMFDAGNKCITLKRSGDVIYHELGHFVAFIVGNIDRQKPFQQIFEREKSRYTKYNKAYVLQNSSEYFAESFKDYTLEPKDLKKSRTLTYAAVEDALDKITEAQTEKIRRIYQAVWKDTRT